MPGAPLGLMVDHCEVRCELYHVVQKAGGHINSGVLIGRMESVDKAAEDAVFELTFRLGAGCF